MTEYMADATNVLKQHLERLSVRLDSRSFELGQLAMALEIVTLIRSLEALPVVSDLGRQEAITALHTLLVEQGIEDLAYEWYDFLSASRRPRFVPEHVPRGIVGVVAPDDGGHPFPHPVGGFSFQPEDRRGESSPLGDSDAKHQVRQSRGTDATYELSESNDGED